MSEALQQLQKQSGNAITDMREQLGAEVTNPSLDLDLKDKTFFEALDEIVRQAQVGTSFFTGDGSIGITEVRRPMDPPAHGSHRCRQALDPVQRTVSHRTATNEPCRATSRPAPPVAQVRLEAAWEPRLRPMLLALKADQLKVRDDQNKEVKPQVAMATDEVVVRPENPVAEINLNLEAPERTAKKIGSLQVKADVTIPAGILLFKFPSLAAKDVTVKQGDSERDPQGNRR